MVALCVFPVAPYSNLEDIMYSSVTRNASSLSLFPIPCGLSCHAHDLF